MRRSADMARGAEIVAFRRELQYRRIRPIGAATAITPEDTPVVLAVDDARLLDSGCLLHLHPFIRRQRPGIVRTNRLARTGETALSY
jgi:hypothetical protein